MKLRTQLVLAALILAIAPLTAIVLYTYHSSRRALESAYRSEAARMTRQMNGRLAVIRQDIETSLAGVTALPLQDIPRSNSSPLLVEGIVAAMGESAALVDALEFQPAPPAQPAAATGESDKPQASSDTSPPQVASAPPAPDADPDEDPDEDRDDDPDEAESPARAAASNAARAARVSRGVAVGKIAVPMGDESLVIDFPAFPRFQPSEDERAKVEEIRVLSRRLGTNSEKLTPEQRKAITDRLRTVNEELMRSARFNQEQFNRQLNEALAIRKKSRARVETRIASGMKGVAPTPVAQAAPQTSVTPRPESGPATTPARSPQTTAEAGPEPNPTVRPKKALTAAEKERLKVRARQTAMLFGHELFAPVESDGKLLGRVTAQVSAEEVVRRVLGNSPEDASEIAFAVDREGRVYARSPAELRTLSELGLAQTLAAGKSVPKIDNWVISTSTAGGTGVKVGVARRIGEGYEELRRTAARNFTYGLGLVALALIGIVPFSNHMTRDVKLVSEGAQRIAQGDLETRVPVRSRNEFGQLAHTFNRMATDLADHQRRLLEEERTRREQEIQQRLLAQEYERKTADLDEARRFQLSLLPKEEPRVEGLDIAAFSQPATEVGGDYYDFHVGQNGNLSVVIGDATGHGAKAGTMVTVIKTLFTSYGGDASPAAFLNKASENIKLMALGRMAMALVLARFQDHQVTIASAGMPSVLFLRHGAQEAKEISLAATPLGLLDAEYREATLPIASGDTLLFMSDGFAELTNAEGQQLGYETAEREFVRAAAAGASAREVVDALVAFARSWHGEQPPNDDMTFVAVRVA